MYSSVLKVQYDIHIISLLNLTLTYINRYIHPHTISRRSILILFANYRPDVLSGITDQNVVAFLISPNSDKGIANFILLI